MTVGATGIYELGRYILNYFILSSTIELLAFIKILLVEILYNVILTIIFYPLLQKAGYYIEESFKGNQILTRYF